MVREGRDALNEFVTLAEAAQRATQALAAASESPRLDAELLLARAIDMPRSYVIAHADDGLDEAAAERFFSAVQDRADGKPMAYITGFREFWSLTLMVTPATLVPRPETEHLVEQAIGQVPRKRPCRVLDLGTGSGAVALAIARERPIADVVATDASDAALAVARENARQLELPNVEFRLGDWCEPIAGEAFDVIASNPPYVADGDPALEKLRYEPRSALTAGPDGLDAIRRLVDECRNVVTDEGVLLIEHGADQADDVAQLFSNFGWRNVRGIRDLAGLPRLTSGRAPDSSP